MNDILSHLRARAAAMGSSYAEMLQAAYDAGFRDGGLAMRNHILDAANAPVAIRAGSVHSGQSSSASAAAASATAASALSATSAASAAAISSATGDYGYLLDPSGSTARAPTTMEKRIASRAPRGLVRKAVEEVLSESPGLAIVEIEDRVVERHPEVARKSIGNQLRRFEGELYKRDGKYNWFLMGDAQKETARPGFDPDLADLM